jgi:ribosomal-protein-alanine N-acetyltransferase
VSEVVPAPLPLTPSLAASLAALHGACFATAWGADEVATLAAMPGAFVGVVETERVAGFVLARVAADEAEIITICVHPAARRRGLGRALLAFALARAAAAGAARLFIEVAADNAAALALYRAAGFEAAGRRRAYYADSGQDALVMRRVLASGAADKDPMDA